MKGNKTNMSVHLLWTCHNSMQCVIPIENISTHLLSSSFRHFLKIMGKQGLKELNQIFRRSIWGHPKTAYVIFTHLEMLGFGAFATFSWRLSFLSYLLSCAYLIAMQNQDYFHCATAGIYFSSWIPFTIGAASLACYLLFPTFCSIFTQIFHFMKDIVVIEFSL